MATQVFRFHNYSCVNICPLFPIRIGPEALGRVIGGKGKHKICEKLVVRASNVLGDFGARNPTPAEVESDFGDKVLGNFGTDHKILIPTTTASPLSLAHRPYSPIPTGHPPMSKHQATVLLRKVVGWRIVEGDGDVGLRLECLWKVKSLEAGMELRKRIASVAEASNHYPDVQLEGSNSVRAQMWTQSIGGLSINDFIVAAKIDLINISDLIPRKRVWA